MSHPLFEQREQLGLDSRAQRRNVVDEEGTAARLFELATQDGLFPLARGRLHDREPTGRERDERASGGDPDVVDQPRTQAPVIPAVCRDQDWHVNSRGQPKILFRLHLHLGGRCVHNDEAGQSEHPDISAGGRVPGNSVNFLAGLALSTLFAKRSPCRCR